MIQSAYLRVYVPADDTVRYLHHVAPMRRAVIQASDYFVWGEPATDDAFRIDVEGRTYWCPRSPRLRMLEGVLAFSTAYPSSSHKLGSTGYCFLPGQTKDYDKTDLVVGCFCK